MDAEVVDVEDLADDRRSLEVEATEASVPDLDCRSRQALAGTDWLLIHVVGSEVDLT